MTHMQILSVCILAAVAAWAYLPTIRLPIPVSKPSLLLHVEQVVQIRSTYKTEDVTAACNALLSVLLKVPQ